MRRAQLSALLQCSFSRRALLPGGVIHTSCPGLLASRLFQRSRLTELLDSPPQPCMPWPFYKPTRPKHWSSCTRAILTQVWCRSCAQWRTLSFGWRKSRRGPLVRRCPLWWSRSATCGWTWQIWGNPTSTIYWTPRSPRQASLVTRWRAWPCPPPHRSERRWSDKKACPGGPSPRALSCCFHLFSSVAPAADFITAAAWSGQQGESVQPVSAPTRLVKCQSKRHPWDELTRGTEFCSSGDGGSTPSPGEGPGWKSFVPYFCCSVAGSSASGTHTFKIAVSYVSGPQEGEDGSVRDTVSTPPPPFPFASGQQCPVRGRNAYSRAPCCTVHSDPTSGHAAFRVGSLSPTLLNRCLCHGLRCHVQWACSWGCSG